MVNLYSEVRKNKRDSIIVLIMFFLFSAILFGVAVFLFTYNQLNQGIYSSFILIYSIVMAIVVLYIFYFLSNGDKMILKVTGAKQANRKNYSYLYHTVEALSLAAGMKVSPKCYIIEDTALNAFATGFKPENSYIVVTTGIIDKLNREELEGVLSHEMSHIKNQDIKIMLYIAGLIGVFTLIGTFAYYAMLTTRGKDSEKLRLIYLGLWILFSVIGVFFATLFRLKLSRQREFLADSNGALLTRYPEGLASALEKIKGDPDPLVDKANKATAALFISTPFRKKKTNFFGNLFATHPPIDERIARLRGKN